MEVDFGSAIVGIISLVIFISPIILMNRKNKSKSKTLLSSLQEIASQYQSTIDQHEALSSFAIGIDTYHKLAYFYKDNKKQRVKYHIDLAEIRECKPEVITQTIKNGRITSKVVESVALNLIPRSDGKRIQLEFFNADSGLQLNGEVKAVEKWSKLINQQLVA